MSSLAHNILGAIASMHNVATVMALVDSIVNYIDANAMWTDRM